MRLSAPTRWTDTIRPPESVTDAETARHHGRLCDSGARAYECDHLAPLELGGAVTDPRNVWPERGCSLNRKGRARTSSMGRLDHDLR